MPSHMRHVIFISQTLSILYLYRDVSSQFLPGPYQMAPQMSAMPTAVQAPIASMMPMQASAVQYPVAPQQKLPIVVMPYYSKTANHQKRERARPAHKKRTKSRNVHRSQHRKRHGSSSSAEAPASCESASSESSNEYVLRSKKTKLKNTRRQVLTPVVSYVTKDGYVIYQKKIRKDKARDWLQLKEKKLTPMSRESLESDDERHSHRTRKSGSSHHHH